MEKRWFVVCCDPKYNGTGLVYFTVFEEKAKEIAKQFAQTISPELIETRDGQLWIYPGASDGEVYIIPNTNPQDFFEQSLDALDTMKRVEAREKRRVK